MTPNPFDEVTFGTQDPPITDDMIVRLLSTIQSNPNSPYINTPALGKVDGGTEAGIDRVNNSNRQQFKKDNVVAYKDENGRAVLTNMDAPARAVKSLLTADDVPAMVGTPSSAVTSAEPAENPNRPNIPGEILKAYTMLENTKDIGEARALRNSLTESLTTRVAQIQKDAITHAASVLKIPDLEASIAESHRLDKLDPYYPGAPSPATNTLEQRLLQVRNQADNIALEYLKGNGEFLRLQTYSKNVESEFARVQNLVARGEQAADRAADRKEEIIFRNTLRDQDVAAQRDNVFIEKYNGYSVKQLARAEMMMPADFDVIKTEQNPDKRKVRIAQLIEQNKNKDFTAAVNAADTVSLLGLALSGNQYAKDALLKEEANTTGMPIEQLKTFLNDTEKKFTTTGQIRTALIRQGVDAQTASTMEARIMLDSNSYDVPKRQAGTKEKADLMIQEMSRIKTANFIQKVDTWGSNDLELQAAILSSKQATNGQADVINVLAAYVKNTPDVQERLKKVQKFKTLAMEATLKHRDSAFGKPDYTTLESQITLDVVRQGWFGRQAVAKTFEVYGNPVGDFLFGAKK